MAEQLLTIEQYIRMKQTERALTSLSVNLEDIVGSYSVDDDTELNDDEDLDLTEEGLLQCLRDLSQTLDQRIQREKHQLRNQLPLKTKVRQSSPDVFKSV